MVSDFEYTRVLNMPGLLRFRLCLNNFWTCRICLNRPTYAIICLNLPEWLFFYFPIVNPCLSEFMVPYFNVYTNLFQITLFNSLHTKWISEIVTLPQQKALWTSLSIMKSWKLQCKLWKKKSPVESFLVCFTLIFLWYNIFTLIWGLYDI